ncbi:MAG: Lrp/AsnC ligand binding domain-containing protein [Chloroflexi bacterium]|nr:Lrp/AsnC ligand binding domain-containing protein [Chloroflexota bacterium]
MAEQAFILIETQVGAGKNVVDALRRIDRVKEADFIIGPYDALVRIEAENVADILEVVRTRVHQIPGIRRTLTCLAVPA